MKRLLIISLSLLFLLTKAEAQDKKIPLTFSLFNNGTSLPGSGFAGVFSRTIHPGFTIGTYFLYHSGEKHEFFQTLKLGFFYHRFVQTGIQLYSEAGYRYLFRNGIFADVMAGPGYLQSIPDVQIFKFKDGRYVQKKNWGRPQFMISANLGLGYDFEKKCSVPLRAFVQYQLWFQTPFVIKYVPLLPNSSLHLGIRYLFNRKSTKE